MRFVFFLIFDRFDYSFSGKFWTQLINSNLLKPWLCFGFEIVLEISGSKGKNILSNCTLMVKKINTTRF